MLCSSLCKPSNYSLQPYFSCFLNSGKFLITCAAEFLFTEAGANGFSTEYLNKLLEKSQEDLSVLKKDSTLDVLLGSMQRFLEKLFFQNINRLMLPKVQIAFS